MLFLKLIEFGLSGEEIHLLVSYIDRLLPLTPDYTKKFEELVHSDESEANMIMTSFEETAMARGLNKVLNEVKLKMQKR